MIKIHKIILCFLLSIIITLQCQYSYATYDHEAYKKEVANRYKIIEGYRMGDEESTHKYNIMMFKLSTENTVNFYRKIGEDYYTGRNKRIKKNIDAAYFWFKKGSKLNDKHSKDRIKEIDKYRLQQLNSRENLNKKNDF